MIVVMMTVVTMTAATMIVVIEKPRSGAVTEFSGRLTGDTAQFEPTTSTIVSKKDRLFAFDPSLSVLSSIPPYTTLQPHNEL